MDLRWGVRGMDREHVRRTLCLADVGAAGLDMGPANGDDGRPAPDRRGPDLKAAVRAANAALKAAAKGPGGWSAKASARPSPRGPVLEVSWTCTGSGGPRGGSAEWRLADLVRGRAHA